MEYFKLKEGGKLPVIGLGPGSLYPKKFVHPKFSDNFIIRNLQRLIYDTYYVYRILIFINNNARALKFGFELIDNSAAYGTAKFLRMAIDKSGKDRSEVFITSRVSNRAQREHRVEEEFMKTLKTYKTNYIDLLQFHWPVTDVYVDTWREIIKLKEKGLVKHIGVANCNIHHLETLYKETGVMPEVNQFEVHPLFTQKELVEYCNQHGIVVEAYTPIARADDRIMKLTRMKQMALKYNKSIIQLIIKWHIQQGRIPVVGSTSKKHQLANLDIFDFELTDEDLNIIDGININSRLRFDPDNCDFYAIG
jgi:diketogulonate reductase-like aldo/keto reductase